MKKITIYIALLGILIVPSLVHGADFYFEQSLKNTSAGDNQLILKLKTGSESVNAVAGSIEIPDGFEISRINTGTSAVLIWLDQPRKAKTIVFSGITPGGFQGNVALFSIGYQAKPGLVEVLRVTDGEVIRNDGAGSVITSKSVPFNISVHNIQSTTTEDKDVTAPESFTVALGQEDASFNGAYFASFAAQDKGTGVQKYESAYTFFFSPNKEDWHEANSPLVLTKGAYFKKIYIKATDGEGNIRLASIDGPYRYAVLWIGIILVLTALCVLFFVRLCSYRYS